MANSSDVKKQQVQEEEPVRKRGDRPKAFADLFTDWERLLTAVNVNEVDLPELSVEPLQDVVNEVRNITARQDAHRAGLRADTRRLRELMVRGQDHALQLRSIIRGRLGPRNAKLAEFRIRILGTRRGVATEPVPPLQPPVE